MDEFIQQQRRRRKPSTEDLQAEIAEQVRTEPDKRIKRLLGRATAVVEAIDEVFEDGDA